MREWNENYKLLLFEYNVVYNSCVRPSLYYTHFTPTQAKQSARILV